jgi:hypothetical protein
MYKFVAGFFLGAVAGFLLGMNALSAYWEDHQS